MQALTSLAKAMADPTRLRLILALASGELCACQLQQLIGCAASTLTAHLSLLTRAGLAQSRKDGRWVYYRLAEAPAPAAAAALAWVQTHAAAQPQVRADTAELKRLRKLGPEQVCCQRSLRCVPVKEARP